jgi:hypothetical protein
LDYRLQDAAQDTHAMGHRESLYRLQDLIEIDDALVGS